MSKLLSTTLTILFLLFTIHSPLLAKKNTKANTICKVSDASAHNVTIIIARHGEKPTSLTEDRGVLNCLGENRALHLPSVMKNMFGTIDKVFAPKPHFTTKYENDDMGAFSMRPLQSALPTATYFNTGVNICVKGNQTEDIAKLATSAKYEGKTLLIVWKHKKINEIAKHISAIYNASYRFEKWKGSDFDTLYIFKIKNKKLNFTKSAEGLNKIIHNSCLK